MQNRCLSTDPRDSTRRCNYPAGAHDRHRFGAYRWNQQYAPHNTDKIGIYIVESPRGERPRAVVVATSAQAACQTVGRLASMTDAEIDALNVGRIGTLDPGINGASFLVDGSRPANIVTDDGIAADYLKSHVAR